MHKYKIFVKKDFIHIAIYSKKYRVGSLLCEAETMLDSTQKKFILGNVLALLSTIIWAGNFIAAKILANEYSGLEMSYWRWLLASFFALPFAFHHFKKDFPALKKEWKLMLFYGVIGCFLSNFLFYNAPHTAPAVDMTILMSTSPLIMMLLARILFQDKINMIWIAGSALALLGVCVLVTKGKLETLYHFNFTIGHFWTLGCSFFFALYSVSMRFFKEKIHLCVFLETTFITAFATAFIICLIYLQKLPAMNDFNHIGAFFYIGVCASFFAFICWNKAIELIGAVRAGIIYYLVPVFGSFFAVVIINESINFIQLFGGTLVLGGVITCTLYKNR